MNDFRVEFAEFVRDVWLQESLITRPHRQAPNVVDNRCSEEEMTKQIYLP